MEVLHYALSVNVVFAIFLGAYWALFRGDTTFILRRAWLLAAALIALFLPSMPSPFGQEPIVSFELPGLLMKADTVSNASTGWGLELLIIGYCSVVGYKLIHLLIRFMQAFRATRLGGEDAFSFFFTIHVPAHYTGADKRALLAHESVHVHHGHSFDVLLFELLCAVFWPIPSWTIALREIRLVHELTADSVASKTHPDYDPLLLATALGVPSDALTMNFHSSNIKQRLNMLHKKRSDPASALKLAIAIPALLGSFALVSWQATPYQYLPQDPLKVAEVMPEFPGGMNALASYFNENVTYPAMAKKNGVEGTAYVSFVVAPDGSVNKVELKKTSDPELGEEAVRVVKGMPKWKPGEHGGKTVPVEMVLPIKFALPSE